MQRKVQIRTKIFLIVLVALIPTLAITVYTALFFQRSYIKEKVTQISNLCEGFTNEQRLIVRNAEEMLLAISQTRAVQGCDYPALNQYLQDLMKVYPDYAVLLATDANGTVVASGVNKTGYSLAERPYFQHAKQTRRFTPGQYIVSRSTGEEAITFTLPVKTLAGKDVFLVCSFSLPKYARELSLERLPPDMTLELFDYFGMRLFSFPSDDKTSFGRPVSDDLFRLAVTETTTPAVRYSIDGVPQLVSVDAVSDNDLSLHVTVRMAYDKILFESYKPVFRTLLVMLLSFLVAFALSLWLARRLFVSRIERLTAYTRAVAHGDLSIRSEINTSRDEITDLVESFNKMACALEERDRSNERTLGEKEQLLQELQKRVSDNLQLLSSMVNLQVGHSSDDTVRHALMTTHSRVMALALVYETIYRYSEVQRVQMHRYCSGLCEYLVSLYADIGAEVSCSVSGIDVSLPIEKALPLALILNELVSNSIIHAFPTSGGGAIAIDFGHDAPSSLTMTLSDNGVGFEDDMRRKDTLGFEMVEALVEQIRGTMTVKSGVAGSEIKVRFPVE